MTEFLESISLFPLVLTLGTYQIGIWCQKKTKHALCNPLLIATILSIAVVAVLGFDLQVYQKGTAVISWLLTPATVCLAVPLYEQLKVLKNHLPAIMVGILTGVAASLFSILGWKTSSPFLCCRSPSPQQSDWPLPRIMAVFLH